jgi:hypothetical protein
VGGRGGVLGGAPPPPPPPPPPPGLSGARSPPRVSVQGASACHGRRCGGDGREPVHGVVVVVKGWGFVLSSALPPKRKRAKRSLSPLFQGLLLILMVAWCFAVDAGPLLPTGANLVFRHVLVSWTCGLRASGGVFFLPDDLPFPTNCARR